MRHAWVKLEYDARTSVGQSRRYLAVCCHCGLEKDWAARSTSWVVGYRLHGGRRYAQTSSYLPTPACPGRLPSFAEIDEWNLEVDTVSRAHPSQAAGYSF